MMNNRDATTDHQAEIRDREMLSSKWTDASHLHTGQGSGIIAEQEGKIVGARSGEYQQ